jgi:hypothetical protein
MLNHIDADTAREFLASLFGLIAFSFLIWALVSRIDELNERDKRGKSNPHRHRNWPHE